MRVTYHLIQCVIKLMLNGVLCVLSQLHVAVFGEQLR